MKRKALVLMLLGVMVVSAMAFGVQPAAALPAFPDWYNCTLLSCGAMSGFYFIFATNNDALWAGSRLFLIDGTNPATKPILAAALTGYSSTGQVSLYSPGGVPPANTFIQGVVAGSL